MRLWKAVQRLPVAEDADPLPEDVQEARLAEDEQALSVIRLGCGSSASSIIRKCATAHEAWELLTRTYAAQSAGRMLSLKRSMNHLAQMQGESISAYVERASAIQTELEELGAGLTSAELASNVLLGTLPAYKAQRDMIPMLPGHMTMEDLVPLLLSAEDEKVVAAEVRAHQAAAGCDRGLQNGGGRGRGPRPPGLGGGRGNGAGRSPTPGGSGSGRGPICWTCGEAGHLARSCPTKKASGNAVETEGVVSEGLDGDDVTDLACSPAVPDLNSVLPDVQCNGFSHTRAELQENGA